MSAPSSNERVNHRPPDTTTSLRRNQMEVERHVMADAAERTPQHTPRGNLARRIAIAVVLSVIFSLALWLMALSAVTSLLAGTGAGVVILAAGNTWDVLETILEAVGRFVLGLLAAIGAILGALLGSLVE
ncbi:MAG: hypothetical protein HC868_02570 [Sphingomonadales bacterium]|nr:hypothetical protein [Sphingomonadales bacterium]